MRILLLGAGGFIGRHILADLSGHGHEVIAVARTARGLAEAFPATCVVAMDLAQAVRPADWAAAVAGVDLIVNVAGVLRGRDMAAVHVDMPRALHAAACDAGVKRVMLVSAISARPGLDTDYAASKLDGERAPRESGLAFTILRPSLVYGDGSYGGTSLIRGIAGLQWLVPIPGDGAFAFTPIHVRDLAEAVRLMCEEERFAGAVLEPVGPETIDLRTLLTWYRAWLGFGAARFLPVPMPIMRAMGRLGDLAGDGPIATNSLTQMVAGNAGDSAAFAQATGLKPRSLSQALAEHPAQVQDRWHARLFFLAPAVRAVLVLTWVASALLGLLYGAPRTAELLAALHLPAGLGDPLGIGTSVLDLGIAWLVLTDGPARKATMAQVVVVAGYSFVIGFGLPGLWLDPLGPLLKNLPVLVLILVHGAIGDKR